MIADSFSSEGAIPDATICASWVLRQLSFWKINEKCEPQKGSGRSRAG